MWDSKPKSWIEEQVVRAEEKEVVWVTAHDRIQGNEYADYQAREAAFIGSLTHQRQTCTPAAIQHEFHTNRVTKDMKSWNWNSLRALVYLEMDKRPLKHWLHKIGRVENDQCACQAKTIPSAAHIPQCKDVGDGKGRKKGRKKGEEWEDEEGLFFVVPLQIHYSHSPLTEGHGEPEPTGHPNSTRARYNFGLAS